jgi:ribosomal protein S18 acetylase RimI-like enzyme
VVVSDARLLDEISINATASAVMQLVDGWLLRASPDLPFRRSNCAIALADAQIESIPVAEEFFARRGRPVVVQVRDEMVELDAQLSARGYALEAATDILVADAGTVVERAPRGTATITLHDELDDVSIAAYGDVMGDTPEMINRIKAYGRMMRSLGPIAFGATALLDEAEPPVGVGFGVVERGWIGYYGVGTALHVRRRGIGTDIMRVLTERGIELGAERAYLQVDHANDGAHALYSGLGFTRSYGYHYRTKA